MVNVDIQNILPYIQLPDRPAIQSFDPLCATLEDTQDCETYHCPTISDCVQKLEYGSTRYLRTSNLWNNTLSTSKLESSTAENINLQKMGKYREQILKDIYKQRDLNPNFKVLDVGGLADSWSWSVSNVVLDFTSKPSTFPSNITTFKGDITRSSGWSSILEYVKKEGKFDYVICTHTIEDLLDPQIVLDHLPLVAKGGGIAVPSRFLELSRLVSGPSYETVFNEHDEIPRYDFRGFFHHAWVFTVNMGVLTGVPKSNLLEDPYFDEEDEIDLAHNFGELQITWEGDEVPIKIFNKGFDELQTFVNLPTEGFYSDHLAGLHALRELFDDDDLSIMTGLLASIEVKVAPGEGKSGVKKLRIKDDQPVVDQVTAFCKVYTAVDCEILLEDVKKYLKVMSESNVPWKKMEVK